MNAPEVLEQLSGRVEELERRVSQLEQRGMIASPGADQAHGRPQPGTTTEKPAAPERATGLAALGPVVTVAGVALLGIAGAYVLRALAGASVVARPLLGFLGAAYAAAWAVAATRASRRLAQGVYAAASFVILAPMLWEMCLRFQAMSPLAAALVLCTYLLVVCISARRALSGPAFSILYAGSALAALALCIGARSMMPFLVIMLAMVVFGEFRRMRGKALPLTAFVWLTTDLAALAMLVVYRVPAAVRPEYPALRPVIVLTGPTLLFLAQTTAVAFQCCIRWRSIAVLDAMQWMAAFALLVLGIFWLAPSSSTLAVGSLCVVLCAACYWVLLSRKVGALLRPNFGLFATWAFLLLIAGQLLLLPQAIAAITLGCAAILAMVAARATQSMALRTHALGFLLVGTFTCGLPTYVSRAMVTDAAMRPASSIALMTILMVAAYALCGEGKTETDGAQVVNFALALTAACAVSAIFTHLLLTGTGLVVRPETFHIALVRTISLCMLALAIIVAGSRLQRAAMNRVAYVLLGLVAVKLVFEDLRHGHFAYLAASIGIVAGTLIAMPRISGRSRGLRP